MEDTLDAYREYLENQELADGTRQIYMRYAEEIEKYSECEAMIKKTVVAYKQEMKRRGAAWQP